jgi:hypothetical protein
MAMKRSSWPLLGAVLVALALGGGAGINQSIRVDDGEFRDGSLSTVNGGITIGDGATVEGRCESVNATVNGPIKLTGAEVDANVTTINGDITLRVGSTVGGDIVIEEARGNNSRRERPLEIELEGGSIVEGNVIVEDPDYPVRLYLRDGSRVMGKIEGAEVIK